MTDDEIAAAWPLIQDRLAAENFVVFPAAPLEPDVEWPDENWSGFLDVAVAVDVKLVYAETTQVTEQDLAEITARYAAAGETVDEETHVSMEAARDHQRRPCRIDLVFAHGGVVHRWMVETPWLGMMEGAGPSGRRDARDLPENQEDEGDDEIDAWEDRGWAARQAAEAAETARLAPKVTEWVLLLSEHRDYLGERSQEERRLVAEKIAPELETWLKVPSRTTPQDDARRAAVYRTLREAEARHKKVRGERSAAAIERADVWAAELQADPGFRDAGSADNRKRRAGDFVVDRLGFADASLRDRLLAIVKRMPTPAVGE